MTGAPIAAGADAIIPVERTRGSGETVEFLTSAEQGAFIRPRGEDLRLGELVISAGKLLTPANLGMLASVNRAMVEVIRRPASRSLPPATNWWMSISRPSARRSLIRALTRSPARFAKPVRGRHS